jgi:hypothetical protein
MDKVSKERQMYDIVEQDYLHRECLATVGERLEDLKTALAHTSANGAGQPAKYHECQRRYKNTSAIWLSSGSTH